MNNDLDKKFFERFEDEKEFSSHIELNRAASAPPNHMVIDLERSQSSTPHTNITQLKQNLLDMGIYPSSLLLKLFPGFDVEKVDLVVEKFGDRGDIEFLLRYFIKTNGVWVHDFYPSKPNPTLYSFLIPLIIIYNSCQFCKDAEQSHSVINNLSKKDKIIQRLLSNPNDLNESLQIEDGISICPICFSEKPNDAFKLLKCTHRFCKQCESDYIISVFKTGNVFLYFKP